MNQYIYICSLFFLKIINSKLKIFNSKIYLIKRFACVSRINILKKRMIPSRVYTLSPSYPININTWNHCLHWSTYSQSLFRLLKLYKLHCEGKINGAYIFGRIRWEQFSKLNWSYDPFDDPIPNDCTDSFFTYISSSQMNIIGFSSFYICGFDPNLLNISWICDAEFFTKLLYWLSFLDSFSFSGNF